MMVVITSVFTKMRRKIKLISQKYRRCLLANAREGSPRTKILRDNLQDFKNGGSLLLMQDILKDKSRKEEKYS